MPTPPPSSTQAPAVPSRLRDLSAATRGVIGVAILAGAALRVWYQAGRAWEGDEVGTVVNLHLDYGVLLTTFRDPWLTMNAYLALVKGLASASSNNAWVMLLPTLLAGVATIPLTAALALRLAGSDAAAGAALLAATNPFLVFYGVQLRSYMLLAAAATAALIACVDWRDTRTWRDGWRLALWAAFAVLMHANGVYLLLFLGLLIADALRRDRRAWGDRVTTATSAIVPLGAALVPVALAYWPLLGDMGRFRAMWSDTPPTSLGYAAFVMNAYLGRGAMVLPSLALLGWGLWDASQRRHRLLIVAVGVAVPVAAASFLGVSHFPWAYARFFVATVPLLLIAIAAGAAHLPGGRVATALALLLVVASWIPGLRDLDARKRDRPWRTIAGHLHATTTAADLLMSTDDGDTHGALALRPLLDDTTAQAALIGPWLAEATAPGRLLLLNAGRPLPTTAPAQTFGAVQLLTYTGTSRAAAVEAAVADLEHGLDHRVATGFSGAYRVLLELRTALGRPDAGGEYTALRYQCLMRSQRVRFTPPQMLRDDD